MQNLMKHLATATYLVVGLHFFRKIFSKCRALFDLNIPVTNEDNGPEYVVRYLHSHYLFSGLSLNSAHRLAVLLIEGVPALTNKLDIVRNSSCTETGIYDLPGLSDDDKSKIDDIWMDYDIDD